MTRVKTTLKHIVLNAISDHDNYFVAMTFNNMTQILFTVDRYGELYLGTISNTRKEVHLRTLDFLSPSVGVKSVKTGKNRALALIRVDGSVSLYTIDDKRARQAILENAAIHRNDSITPVATSDVPQTTPTMAGYLLLCNLGY